MQSLPYFKTWSFIKLLEMNEKLNETKYQAEDIVFNIGADAEVFYILKSGRMIIETIVEIEDYHKYPVGN